MTIAFGRHQVCKCSPDSVRIDMDAFLTKLFDGSPESSRAAATLGDGAWVFSCVCGQCYSSEDPNYTVEVHACLLVSEEARARCNVILTRNSHQMMLIKGQWFECSKCKIWAHLGCVHQDLGHLKVRSC